MRQATADVSWWIGSVSSLQTRQAAADVSCWIGLVSSLQMVQATADVSWWIGFVSSLQMRQAAADVSCWIGLVSSLQMRQAALTPGQVTRRYFDVVIPWHLSVFLLLSTTQKQDKWKLCVLFANSKCLPRVTEERRQLLAFCTFYFTFAYIFWRPEKRSSTDWLWHSSTPYALRQSSLLIAILMLLIFNATYVLVLLLLCR